MSIIFTLPWEVPYTYISIEIVYNPLREHPSDKALMRFWYEYEQPY